MTIVSHALGIETAFVVTCQVCRSVFVLTFAPVFFRLLGVRKPQPSALPSSGAGRAKPGDADD